MSTVKYVHMVEDDKVIVTASLTIDDPLNKMTKDHVEDFCRVLQEWLLTQVQ